MIIDTVVNALQTTSKVKGSKMTINVNGSSFGFILENLYTKPHKAIVRELVCNAIDAHQAVGNPNPYFIQVPSRFDPTFILRDFGPGLNEEEIDQYLNTLYESSKGSTNDQIGGFGLGSKSPFALVPSFFLTSYKDGMEYKCFWYRDSEGIPVLKVQSINQTTEPNGLKYTINFAEKDVELIAKACETELYNFSLLPKFFSNIEDPSTEFNIWEPYNLKKLEDTDTYAIYTSNDLSLFTDERSYYYKAPIVSIGGVVYKVTNRDCLNLYATSISRYIGDSCVAVIKIPIGKLKLPSTREHILETTENAAILKEYLEKTYEDISTKIQVDFQKLFEDDYKISPLQFNLANYYKYCKEMGYNPKYLNELLYNKVSLPDLDFFSFLNKDRFGTENHKLVTDLFNYTSTHNVFNLLIPLGDSKLKRVEALFYQQNVVTGTYKVVPKNYSFNPTSNINNTKTLFIYADARVPASYLYGIKDIETYTAIEIIRPSAFIFNGIPERLEQGFEMLSVIAGACGWSLIKASDIQKPENHKASNRTISAQAFSHYKIVTTSDFSSPKKIFKQIDDDGKPIPFGLEYIEDKPEIFYKLKRDVRWLPLNVRCYLKHYKIDNIYCIDESKEEEFLALFKDHPTIKNVIKIEDKIELNLAPLFNDEINLLINFCLLLESCNYNLNLFEMLARNVLTAYPYLSEESFTIVLNYLKSSRHLNIGSLRSVMFNIVKDYELRQLINQITSLDKYKNIDIINSAYSNLNIDTVSTFLDTCIPPALKDRIHISIKDS